MPQAAGGIPTGYALHAVTPAAGQESLRLAGSAPPFDKGGVFPVGGGWGDCTEGLLWPEAGTAARGLTALRSPFG